MRLPIVLLKLVRTCAPGYVPKGEYTFTGCLVLCMISLASYAGLGVRRSATLRSGASRCMRFAITAPKRGISLPLVKARPSLRFVPIAKRVAKSPIIAREEQLVRLISPVGSR